MKTDLGDAMTEISAVRLDTAQAELDWMMTQARLKALAGRLLPGGNKITRLPFACAAGLLALGMSSGVLGADIQAVVGWSQKGRAGYPGLGCGQPGGGTTRQLVKKGDNLITLDNRGFNSLVSRRQAELRTPRAALQEAQREDERGRAAIVHCCPTTNATRR